jgi:hypothetical protein
MIQASKPCKCERDNRRAQHFPERHGFSERFNLLKNAKRQLRDGLGNPLTYLMKRSHQLQSVRRRENVRAHDSRGTATPSNISSEATLILCGMERNLNGIAYEA